MRRGVPMRRGPGLIGTAARTAVVAGTATAVAGGVRGHQERRAQEQYAEQQQAYDQQQADIQAQVQAQVAAQQQAQAAAPPAASGSAGISDDDLAKLTKLSELRKAGVLSEAEFNAEKAKILGA